MVLGRQIGNRPTDEKNGLDEKTPPYVHTAESWTAFWREIGQMTGIRWHIETWEEEPDERWKAYPWFRSSMIALSWAVKRDV